MLISSFEGTAVIDGYLREIAPGCGPTDMVEIAASRILRGGKPVHPQTVWAWRAQGAVKDAESAAAILRAVNFARAMLGTEPATLADLERLIGGAP